MAWAHALNQSSSMASPYEHRELMKAAFGYSNKTPTEVIAEQKKRHEESRSKTRTKSGAPAATGGTPRQSEIDKMKALLANAGPRPQGPAE